MALAERPSSAWDVADLVDQQLLIVPNPLAAWNSDTFWVSVWDSDPGQVLVSLMVPRESAEPSIQLRIGFAVTEEGPEIQSERIVAALRRPHPLHSAVVCAGDRECAEAYGYVWPSSLEETATQHPRPEQPHDQVR
ncbi:hypothetical protein [Streptomyces amritsarensis]|uniref:hypothetical protein n=1 Tax=Streptomyces amritsarensis TaxID=681158 RepID=UPI0036AC3DAE